MKKKKSKFEFMATSKKELVEAINQLRSLDLKSAEYIDVRKHIDVLVRCGFLIADFPEHHQPIYRGRVVKQDGIFHKVSEISYPPPVKSKLTYNRASSNMYPIFYG